MRLLLSITLCASMAVLQACTEQAVKRTTFATIQNIGAMNCTQALDGDCTPRLDYDSYQRERNALHNDIPLTPDQTENCDLCAGQYRGAPL